MQALAKPLPPLPPFPANGQTSFWAEILMIWKMSPHHVTVPQGLPDPRRSGLSRGAPRRCQAAPAQRSRWPGSVQVDRVPAPPCPRPRELHPAPSGPSPFPRHGGFPPHRRWRGRQGCAGGMPLRRRGRRAGDSAARRVPARRCPPAGAELRPHPGPAAAPPARRAAGTTPLAAPWRDRGAPQPPMRHRPVPSRRRDSCGARLGEQWDRAAFRNPRPQPIWSRRSAASIRTVPPARTPAAPAAPAKEP